MKEQKAVLFVDVLSIDSSGAASIGENIKKDQMADVCLVAPHHFSS